jgi:nucleoside-diphosphate-sugar epimerase
VRVLVAGGAGFIGNHVCEGLLGDGNDVICVDNLLTGTLENIERFSRDPSFEYREESAEDVRIGQVDVVINLASPASPVDFDRIPLEIIRANVSGTWRLLEIARDAGAMFLFASTSEVYGDPQVHPQPETYFGNVDPVGPRACYDESKRLGEALVATFVRVFGVNARIVRIFNTYGPRMRVDDGRVVPEFVMAALRGTPLMLHGGGDQTRSFCYVDDLIRGILEVAFDSDNSGEIFNLGNPDELSVRQLAETIVALTGSASRLIPGSGRPQDPSRRQPDISKMTKRYGWKPTVALDQGLLRTITWFRDRSPERAIDAAPA